MAQLFANLAESALAADITAGATTLTVATGEGARFPAVAAPDYLLAVLDDRTHAEVVKITAHAAGTDTFTVARAQEDMAGAAAPSFAFAAGTKLSARLTAATMTRQAPPFARPKATPGIAYMVPGGVSGVNISNTQNYGGGRLHYEPWLLRNAVVIDQLALEVATPAVAGSLLRVGIYRADADWQPLALVVDAGAVAADASGLKAVSVALALGAGRYLAALHAQNTTTLRRALGGFELAGLMNNSVANCVNQIFKTLAYGPLVDPGVPWDSFGASTVPMSYALFARITGEA